MDSLSYRVKYLKIYFWQGFSFILSFLSMFIVVPYLSKDPAVYGIYTVCLSVTIFLAYADLGFLYPGNKFAAECYARGERENEIEIVGFITYILIIFVSILSILIIYISYRPELLFNNFINHEQIRIAHKLLLILALFAPIIVIQPAVEMIYGIRLDNYIYQSILIISNLIKIISVLYFFNNKYQIVEYYLFSQSLSAVALILILFYAKRKYNYNMKYLLRCVKFNRQIFNKTKKLAFSTIFLLATQIVYWEIDSIVIAKYYGASYVAIYSIGITVASFLRNIFSVLYNPFNARINHFIGQNNSEGLKLMLDKIIVLTIPIVVLPICVLFFASENIIMTWVGISYQESIDIVRFFLLCYLFSFISYPASMLLMAHQKNRQLIFIGLFMSIIYWLGIFFTSSIWGINSFAIFKFVVGILLLPYYAYYLLRFLNIQVWKYILRLVKPIIISILFSLLFLLFIKEDLPNTKSTFSLFVVLIYCGIGIIIGFITYYVLSDEFRKHLKLRFFHF